MKRVLLWGLSVALLVGTAVACSQNAFEPVRVTKSDAVVAGCEKVGDIAVGAKTPDNEVIDELSSAARSKGGNYVVVPADGARTGAAYRCTQPSATAAAR
jgi:hypothetical protein